MATLNVGKQLTGYTGVIIHTGLSANGSNIDYSAGNSSGYVLELTNPVGTQAMAYNILSSLKLRNTKYQPFEAESALMDPAAEIGDNVTCNGTSAFIANRRTQYTAMLPSEISAPYDEEVNSAFKYEPKTVREFKRESAYARSRISQNEEQIALEVVRATNAENSIGSRITLTANAITAEVTRATAAEGSLSSRVTQTSQAITSEVTRATNAEGALGTRIDQRLNSITLSVSSSAGSSVFTIKDGSTTLTTQTLDLSVKAVNVSGTLTASQIAAGSITIGKLDADAKSKLVVQSQARTQYALISSSSTPPAENQWSNSMPTWVSGKYLWTRERTYNKYADDSYDYTYSPDQNGRYDENLTTSLATASSASSTASGAQSSANSAALKTCLIYISTAGGVAPTPPNSWVSNLYANQNEWTQIRPTYSSTYPVVYVARQSETVGGTYSVTTPQLENTTTVIDGSHITTGTIDANRINVNGDLSAFGASVGGWAIGSVTLRKTTDYADVYLQSTTNDAGTYNAICVRTRPNAESSWTNQFYVRYNGYLYAKNASIEGTITATAGTIGGVTISNGTLSGISDTNIATGGISGGSGSSIALSTIDTNNTVSGINTNLGYGAAYGQATTNGTSSYPTYFKASYLVVASAISMNNAAYTPQTKTIAGVTIHYLGY